MEKTSLIARCFLWLFGIVLIAQPGVAFAHATPVDYEITPAPQADGGVRYDVRIRFSEHVEESVSALSLLTGEGTTSQKIPVRVDTSDRHILTGNFLGTANEEATLSWQVISEDDGHFSKGSFLLQKPAGGISSALVPNGAGSHEASPLENASIWMELMGGAMLLGAFILLWTLGFDARRPYPKRFSGFVVFSGLLLLLGSLAYIGAEAQNAGASFLQIIGTHAGFYALLGAGLSLIALVLFVYDAPHLWIIAVVTLALLARTIVSHAAATPFHPALSVAINFIHLFFKDVWAGGAIAFFVVFFPLALAKRSSQEILKMTNMFSRVMSVAIGVGGVSGVYVTWLHLKDPSNIFLTPWGTAFLLLSSVAGFFFAIRLYHHFFLERTLKNPDARASLPHTIALEMALGVAVLFLTSVIITTTPPYRSISTFIEKQEIIGVTFSLQEHPFETGMFLVSISPKPGDIKNVSIFLANSERGIGPLAITPEKRFPGGYVFPESALGASGVWDVKITAERATGYDAVAHISVAYPKDVVALRKGPDDRSFGMFEAILSVLALTIALGSVYLYRTASHKKAGEDYPVEIDKKGAWIFGVLVTGGIFVLLVLPHGSHPALLRSPFEDFCIKKGDTWEENVPKRAGVIVSPDFALGCSTKDGNYHFADGREYLYFTQTESSTQK